MAESNSQPTRCPCGFFGSSQTLGLCSKCFREREQNRDQMTADVTRSSSVSMEIRMEREASSAQDDNQHNNLMPQTEPDTHSIETGVPPLRVAPLPVVDGDAGSVAAADTLSHQRGTKRKADELDGDESEGAAAQSDDVGGRLEPAAGDDAEDQRPIQKNKKRCFACSCRMDLAIREIGKCKCEYIFCALHRLPEQHNCTFDHKEHCRQEARAKMVVLKKHVGTALKRLDSDS